MFCVSIENKKPRKTTPNKKEPQKNLRNNRETERERERERAKPTKHQGMSLVRKDQGIAKYQGEKD